MEIEKFSLREFNIDNEFEGIGGEALVSKAQHPRLGKVAIKRWLSNTRNSDNELNLLIQNCNHPNIVQFVGILINTKSNAIGYVMPYMPNGSLADVIHNKSQNYDEKQMSSWITQICYGLSHLHFKKIIHRDIKPSNVLLGKSQDDIKLSDFGLARSLQNITETLTKGLGTPIYMAPEILKSEDYTTSADIYSLSITISEILHRRYEILMTSIRSRQPFDHFTSKNSSMPELCNRIFEGERPTLRTDLSEKAVNILEKFEEILSAGTCKFRCWDANVGMRPTIHMVLELLDSTGFVYLDLKSTVEGNRTSLDRLNISNGNDDETFSKTITASNDDEWSPIPPRVTSEKSPFPKPIEKGKEAILLLGGGTHGTETLDSLLILQNNGNWKEMEIKLPYATCSHGAQFLDNYLYIFGGYNEKQEILNLTYKSTGDYTWLTKSLQWVRMADMNEKCTNISNSNVILNNRIWVCGGWSGEEYLKSVKMYDPETNKWKYMKQMNQCRTLAAAAVVNGRIFCCGGWNGYNTLNSAECYDPSSDVWTYISNMPGPNGACGIVVMGAHLIVIGGKGNKDKDYLSSVWVLDTDYRDAEWIEASSMSLARCQPSIAKIDGKVFVCGGFCVDEENLELKCNNYVEIFDGEAWRNGPKMPTCCGGAPAVVVPMEFGRSLN